MTSKFKSAFFVLSLFLNGIFISIFILSSFYKSSSFYYHSPPDDYVTACAVVSVPSYGEATFELITVSLNLYDKAYLQFSFISQKQRDLLINAIYDPNIISISHTEYGIEITAVSEGETLMQTVTNDGIKNVALIRVVK